MDDEACATCAAYLSSIPPMYDEKTEKPAAHERRLDCCGRAICARCTSDNPRFQTYCPYCQVSTKPTSLPQGLRDPPPYSPPQNAHEDLSDSLATSTYSELPQYSDICDTREGSSEKSARTMREDVLHFVDPVNDTVNSLAIRYGVPANALRKKNHIYQDHLMAGRRTILIPGEFYTGGVSLSPRPIEGEEEELRKSKIRKFMVACKVSEYEVATLYMKQADYDLDMAVQAFKSDEEWERNNPLSGKKGKAVIGARPRNERLRIGGGISAQLA